MAGTLTRHQEKLAKSAVSAVGVTAPSVSSPANGPARGRLSFDDGDKVLSADETAERLGIKPDTLKHWRMRGYGPSHLRIGRRVGYRLRSIREWLDLVEHRSTMEPDRVPAAPDL